MVGDADSKSSDAGSLHDSRAAMPSSMDIVGDCQGDLASYRYGSTGAPPKHNSASAERDALKEPAPLLSSAHSR